MTPSKSVVGSFYYNGKISEGSGGRSASASIKELRYLLQCLGQRGQRQQTRSLLGQAVKQALPSSWYRSQIEECLSNHRTCDSDRLAKAIHRAFQQQEKRRQLAELKDLQSAASLVQRRPLRVTGYQLYLEESAATVKTSKPSSFSTEMALRSGFERTRAVPEWSELPDQVKARYERRARSAQPPPKGTLASTVMADDDEPPATALAFDVSSDESGGGGCVSSAFSSDESATTFEQGLGDDPSSQNLYGRFLEAMHLEVASRVSGLLEGRIFHTYALSGPVSQALPLKDVRKRLIHEFLSLQRGGGGATVGRGRRPHAWNECRVYTSQPKSPGTTWLQVNLGPLGEAGGVGHLRRKSTAPGAVYLVVIQAGGTHIAVTGSGVTAKDRTTGLILASLEAAVTYSDSNTTGVKKKRKGYVGKVFKGLYPRVQSLCFISRICCGLCVSVEAHRRIHALSGPDPIDLLRSASALFDGTAIGRFAMYRDRLNASDTMDSLDSVARGAVSAGIGPSNERGTDRTRKVLQVAEVGVTVDHSVGERLKRKAAHIANFGRPVDCPKRTRIRWDITSSETTALSQALVSEEGFDPGIMMGPLPTHRFKCRVALQGPDVFAGMRAFTEAGVLSKAPPDCVRDAPCATNTSGTIHVVDGMFDVPCSRTPRC
jgi:hypothetical protein